MGEMDVSVSITKAKIQYNSEAEKERLQKAMKDLTRESNNIVVKYGKLDEKILLFFLLVKTQAKLIGNKNNIEELFFAVLDDIYQFISDKNENINEVLVLLNIYKQAELNNKKNKNELEDDNKNVIEDFVNQIKKQIETIKQQIYLK